MSIENKRYCVLCGKELELWEDTVCCDCDEELREEGE